MDLVPVVSFLAPRGRQRNETSSRLDRIVLAKCVFNAETETVHAVAATDSVLVATNWWSWHRRAEGRHSSRDDTSPRLQRSTTFKTVVPIDSRDGHSLISRQDRIFGGIAESISDSAYCDRCIRAWSVRPSVCLLHSYVTWNVRSIINKVN